MMPRTLTSRGFTLPDTIPPVGHRIFDKFECWHSLALTKVIHAFLFPEFRNASVCGNTKYRVAVAVGKVADADGFTFPMGFGRDVGQAIVSSPARERIAAWIGIAPEVIWPHHALGNAIVLSKQPPWRGMPASTWTPAQLDKASAVLFGYDPGKGESRCHAVPALAEHGANATPRAQPPLYRPARAFSRLLTAIRGGRA